MTVFKSNCCSENITLKKYVNNEDASVFGAFPDGTKLLFELEIKSNSAYQDIVFELQDRFENTLIQYDFVFYKRNSNVDVYQLTVDFSKISLYNFRITAKTPDNFFELNKAELLCDQILIYDKNFVTPGTFKGGIIYQIFPDRFARSEEFDVQSNKLLHNAWYEDPKHPKSAGEAFTPDDFFGGSLFGIIEKLDYISSLGVDCIYLNPIFRSSSNHRYDTGDYTEVDQLLGGNNAFAELIKQAKSRNIKVILDGVFSHTGSDSKYFNKAGSYNSIGAYQDKNSPYYDWYSFIEYPERYRCWWGFETLPEVNKSSSSFREYILGENGIIRRYIRQGISGWRLDVADELPDDFIEELRASAKQENDDAIILGEVWENASNKESYGKLRRYLLGSELDSVMNYPLRNAVIDYILSGDSTHLYETSQTLYKNYPKCVSDLLMNFLSTHDTPRILSVLKNSVSEADSIKLLKLAYLLISTLPGIPSIFYGDEAGLEGEFDPLNRRCYPWGRENTEILVWFKKIGEARKRCKDFKEGIFKIKTSDKSVFAFYRSNTFVCVNRSNVKIKIVFNGMQKREHISDKAINDFYILNPLDGCILS